MEREYGTKVESSKREVFGKTILSFLFLLLVVHAVYGAPASKQIHILGQSDGSFFPAKQWGDERNNGWETAFGYTILYDKDIRNWVYADKDTDGKLIKTKYVVVRDSPPSVVKKSLRPKPAFLPSKAPGMEEGDEGLEFSLSASYPKTGTINVPVILIKFPDAENTYTDTEIHDVIFADTSDSALVGTVKNYFEEVSYEALVFADTDVVSWDTSLQNHNHYGYKQGGVANNDEAAELVKEAVEKADTALNYSLFDYNNDGYVDGVVVIHQGRGAEESGQDTDIWSHTWSLSAAGLDPYESDDTDVVTEDTIFIDTYIIIPETIGNDTGIMTIGVFCHEFGHLLGLPDLYDTSGYTYGIGDWDTMAYGFWNEVSRPGDSPVHFCAWSKWLLGWITPIQIETVGRLSSTQTEIKAVEDDADAVYQLLDNPDTALWNTEGEYFLLENRQSVGFDAALPDTGLLIWHIDESRVNNNADITDLSHKLVDLEEADGDEDLDNKENQGDAGDPYPGMTNNTAFDFQSDPDNELYTGESGKVRVEDIELSDTDILAYIFINEDPELSGALLTPDEGDTSTFFTYAINYQDDDGDTPEFKYIIIDDGDAAETHFMSLNSGTADDGAYVYYTPLAVGEYTYYFQFNDGEGGVARLPADSGSYSGPTVSVEEEEEPQPEPTADEEDTKDMSAVQWHCFIATASYGTPMAKEVKILSQFRDEYLITSPVGKKFVNLYYKFSPPLASFISKHPLLRKCVRGMLKPVVKIAKTYCSQPGNN